VDDYSLESLSARKDLKLYGAREPTGMGDGIDPRFKGIVRNRIRKKGRVQRGIKEISREKLKGTR